MRIMRRKAIGMILHQVKSSDISHSSNTSHERQSSMNTSEREFNQLMLKVDRSIERQRIEDMRYRECLRIMRRRGYMVTV